MKIALAQINTRVNDIEGNRNLIVDAINRAKNQGAELIVFPELSVCGNPPDDLLNGAELIERSLRAIDSIAPSCQGICAIVGGPSHNSQSAGKPIFNSAFVLENGTIASVHSKGLLPTYDVFDDYRYFEPCTEFKIAQIEGKRVAITICEDLWEEQPLSSAVKRSRLYKASPMSELAKQKPDIIVNLAALPFSEGCQMRRIENFRGVVKRYNLPVVCVNQVGANTDLIYDGGSMVLNGRGEVVLRMKQFGEDLGLIDIEQIDTMPVAAPSESENRIELMYRALILGISDFFRKLGFEKATLGLSGGLDSAVALCLAQQALGSSNLRVLLLPSQYSPQHSIDDAKLLAENLGVQYDIIGIEGTYEQFIKGLEPIFDGLPSDLAEENIQARVRGVMLMALSNKLGYLLLNTSNKSEAAVGYGTLYGDMCGALSVLGDVYKTDVYALAFHINREREIIPFNTLAKPPSAELRPNQKDSDSLPDYDTLDRILQKYIEEGKTSEAIIAEGFEPEVVNRTIRLVNTSEHKRFQCAPILRVSGRAFGRGCRMPIVSKF